MKNAQHEFDRAKYLQMLQAGTQYFKGRAPKLEKWLRQLLKRELLKEAAK